LFTGIPTYSLSLRLFRAISPMSYSSLEIFFGDCDQRLLGLILSSLPAAGSSIDPPWRIQLLFLYPTCCVSRSHSTLAGAAELCSFFYCPFAPPVTDPDPLPPIVFEVLFVPFIFDIYVYSFTPRFLIFIVSFCSERHFPICLSFPTMHVLVPLNPS